jgi:hypothetical protein
MSTDRDFNVELDMLGLSQSGLARLMKELGDPRSFPTILRSVSNWCRGVTAVPGEAWVMVTLLARDIDVPYPFKKKA